MRGLAERPIIEEMVTMRPHRWRRMWGAVARRVLNTPPRLVSTVSDHPAASRSKIDPSVEMPALATAMSTEPNSATTSSTKAIMASRSRTSATAEMQRRPSASTRRTVSARSSGVARG